MYGKIFSTLYVLCIRLGALGLRMVVFYSVIALISPKESQSQTLTVVAIHPKQDDVVQSITLPGSIEPFEKTELFAKVTGYIEQITVDIGDYVKKNQLLLKLTIPEMMPDILKAETEVLAAKARLQKAEADAVLTRVTYKRLADLREMEPGAIAQQDVDVAAAQEKVAEAQIEIMKADLEIAKAQVVRLKVVLNYAEIRAPYDGIITKRYFDTGALVEAGRNSGHPALEIMEIDTVRLVLDLPETIIPLVEIGYPATFQFDTLPGQIFDGKVTRTSRMLKSDVRSMRAEIHCENPKGIFQPGTYAKVSLSLTTLPNVFTLPSTSLRPREDSQGVLMVKNNILQWVPVNLLIDNGATIVVKGDIDTESLVVLASSSVLEEGQNVNVQMEGTTGS